MNRPDQPAGGAFLRRRGVLRSAGRGVSLVEVVVSAALLAAIAMSILAALSYAAQVTRLNGYAISAKNIAQGFFERMQIDDFDNVCAEKYPNIEYDSDPPVWLDQGLGIKCQVHFRFTGFGALTDASAQNLTEANVGWEQDEWNGNTVFLTSGQGAGQYGVIDFSTPNTLHLAEPLDVAPKKGTTYMINNGKTVQITVSYSFRGKTHSQTVSSLIINYRE